MHIEPPNSNRINNSKQWIATPHLEAPLPHAYRKLGLRISLISSTQWHLPGAIWSIGSGVICILISQSFTPTVPSHSLRSHFKIAVNSLY
jgi:hypothetical protein